MQPSSFPPMRWGPFPKCECNSLRLTEVRTGSGKKKNIRQTFNFLSRSLNRCNAVILDATQSTRQSSPKCMSMRGPSTLLGITNVYLISHVNPFPRSWPHVATTLNSCFFRLQGHYSATQELRWSQLLHKAGQEPNAEAPYPFISPLPSKAKGWVLTDYGVLKHSGLSS